jgi:ABC-type transport system involved in cytochrome c biogenesis permease subunit
MKLLLIETSFIAFFLFVLHYIINRENRGNFFSNILGSIAAAIILMIILKACNVSTGDFVPIKE